MEDEEILATLPKELRRLAILHRLEGDFTYLQMEVVTFADLWERADVVVDFIERAARWRSISCTSSAAMHCASTMT